MDRDLTLEELIARRNRVSPSKSVYIESEGMTFMELHNLASELNRRAYNENSEVVFKIGGKVE